MVKLVNSCIKTDHPKNVTTCVRKNINMNILTKNITIPNWFKV